MSKRKANQLLRVEVNRFIAQVKDKNERVSLRTISQRLKVSPSTLSLFLNDKRQLSYKSIHTILSCLSETNRETKQKILASYDRSSAKSKLPLGFKVKWEHFIILSYMMTEVASQDEKAFINQLANKINTTKENISKMVGDLLKANLIEKRDNRFFNKYPDGNFEIPGDLDIRSINQSILVSAQEKFNELKDPLVFKNTDFTAITVPGKLQKIALAKQKIIEFQEEMSSLLDDESRNNTTFTMSIQLFTV